MHTHTRVPSPGGGGGGGGGGGAASGGGGGTGAALSAMSVTAFSAASSAFGSPPEVLICAVAEERMDENNPQPQHTYTCTPLYVHTLGIYNPFMYDVCMYIRILMTVRSTYV